MEKITESSLVFYVALEMLYANRAESAEEAFRIWPQRQVPATLNAVKIAFARIRGRGFSRYVMTQKGMDRVKAIRPSLEAMLEKRLADLNDPKPPGPIINSVFALGGAPWHP